MFGFLKDKLKSWLGKSKKDLEEKSKKNLVKQSSNKKEKKTEEKKLKEKKADKLEKKTRTKEEIKQERKVTEEVFKDIKKEEHTIQTPEEEFEKVIRKEAEKENQEDQIKEEIKSEEKTKKRGFFSKLRSFLAYNITESDFEAIFSDLELALLENNVALEVVEELKKKIKQELLDKEIKKQDIEEEIKKALKKSISSILLEPEDLIEQIKEHKKFSSEKKEPFKMLFFGINGTGKTTSIAKFASLCLKNKISVILAAADTFRAASIEQLQIHADKLGIKMIKHDYNADPSAVAFDAIKYAQSHSIDVVLIDTAGRMHTRENLIKEMEKITRVTKPNLKVFVAESIAGNDATEQARVFNEAIGIDGSILSKVDVDEKGGTILSIAYITKKPILYLGMGQNYGDLKLFNKEDFLKNLGL